MKILFTFLYQRSRGFFSEYKIRETSKNNKIYSFLEGNPAEN